ncbi:MAG TPA: lipid A biosynthesis acyltransferase [Crenotrichaceae bacterium]|nr:lipid A biosynthesis acyltransferase [Crenotrichaceae bacterium]
MSKDKKQTHWAQIEETGAYWGMRLLVFIYRVFGRTAFRIALYPTVAYYFVTNRQARAASRDYLQHLQDFDPGLGINNTLATSFRHFFNFAEGVLDKIVVWMGSYDFDHVRFHGYDEFCKMLDNGAGAMIIGAHIGNMEVCRAIAEKRKTVRLNILIHTRNMEKYNKLLRNVDTTSAMQLIQVTELNPAMAISLHEKVQQGECIILVGDRIPINSPARIVEISFLGEKAAFTQGPYLLASLLKCPVYTFCSIRGDDGHYDIYLDPLEQQVNIPRKDPQRQVAIEKYARQYVDRLQAYCLKAPLQWFNFFPFWEKPDFDVLGHRGRAEQTDST